MRNERLQLGVLKRNGVAFLLLLGKLLRARFRSRGFSCLRRHVMPHAYQTYTRYESARGCHYFRCMTVRARLLATHLAHLLQF